MKLNPIKQLNYKSSLLLSLLFLLIISLEAFAAKIGNNYEQRVPPAEGVELPRVRIVCDTEIQTGETVDLSAYEDIDDSGIPFFYWYANAGSFSKHDSYPNYNTVKYTAPNVAGVVKITAQVGDTLGYIGLQTIFINVIDNSGGGGSSSGPDGCSYTVTPSTPQSAYSISYRLKSETTAGNIPTGHFYIQPESGDFRWSYTGSVGVMIDGEMVDLYTDSELNINTGKRVTYHAGDDRLSFWINADFQQDTEIIIEHREDSATNPFYPASWIYEVTCDAPPSTGYNADLATDFQYIQNDLVKPGEMIETNFKVQNIGADASEATTVGYYLSTNGASWDSADTLLRQDNLESLFPGYANIYEFAVIIPSDAPAGDHYLIFKADDSETVSESDESNNESAILIKIRDDADLVLQSPSVSPTNITAGEWLNTSVTLSNNGSLSTQGSSRIGYFISTNGSSWDSADILLGTSEEFGMLTIGQQKTFNKTVKIPSGIAGGTHYLVFYADYANFLPESNNDNNLISVPINVAPAAPGGQDATVEWAKLGSPSANLGENISVYASVKNIGSEYLRSTMLGYFFSDDDQWDSSDVFKGDDIVDAMAAGQSTQESDRISQPSGITPGQYYILFVADYDNRNNESNESNNVFAVPVHITAPDLVAEKLSVSSKNVSPGNMYEAITQIRNSGNGLLIGNAASVFYLSEDTRYDAGDIGLGELFVTEAAPNSSAVYAANVVIPSNTVPGSYYLLLYLDRYDSVRESDETNNLISIPIVVEENMNYNPIVNAGADAAADVGEQITLTFSFTDQDAGDMHSALINWGDGTPAASGTVDQTLHTVTATHAYSQAGSFSVKVTVADDKNGMGSDTLTITVGNSEMIVTVSPLFQDVPEIAGTTSFTVSNSGSGQMSWTANTVDTWLEVISGNAGTNSGTVQVGFGDNSAGARTGKLTVTAPGSTNLQETVEIRQISGLPAIYKLTKADSTLAQDEIGKSISMYGDYVIAGAPSDDTMGSDAGAAYIFKSEGDDWILQTKLVPSDGIAGGQYGASVALYGAYAIVGSPNDDDKGGLSGSVYVYRRSNDSWNMIRKLTASDGAGGDNFGWSVSMFEDEIVVGAPRDDFSNVSFSGGAVYFFDVVGDSLYQSGKVRAASAVTGETLGYQVDIWGDYAIAGTAADAAYILKKGSTSWAQQTRLTASDGAAYDQFGWGVSISGDFAVVGAQGQNNYTGAAYIFRMSSGSWRQYAKITAFDRAERDFFGRAVSVSGDYLIAGAVGKSDNGYYSGAAYLYEFNGSSWLQKKKWIDANGSAGDQFGFAVDVSGRNALAGSPNNDSTGSVFLYNNVFPVR